jgi:hypothetical protein
MSGGTWALRKRAILRGKFLSAFFSLKQAGITKNKC